MLSEAEKLLPDLVALRRAIHREPELGLHTPKTVAKVRQALAGLPLEWREGPTTSGLVALLRGARPGRSVLLRGDMDALPMQEETGLEYASQVPNAMHACGHDAHTAMLVGAARLLCARQASLAGSVMFMFQPGEESWDGARLMIEDGLIDPLPDAAYALHVIPNAESGVVRGRPGPTFASMDPIRIQVTGRGGHGSAPHDALDPVPVACEIVMAIQGFVTRQVSVFDPCVVTIGRIDAGTTHNVIPEKALLSGTMRTLSPENRERVKAGLRRLAEGIAAAHGATAEVSFDRGFPVTVSDARAVELARATAKSLFGPPGWQDMDAPLMAAEDFSYVLEKVPGALLLLGAATDPGNPGGCCGLHSNRMLLDEQAMPRGAALMAAVAERFLAGGFESG
jgi:amidohydrolase